MQREFTQTFRAGRISRANAYSMDKQFAPNIRTALHYYNINHQKLTQEQKVKKVLTKIESMKEILGQNIQLVLRQTVNLEKMVQKSEKAKESSLVFKKKAAQVRRKLWLQNNVYCVILMIAVVMFTYMMMALFCGFRLNGCRRGTDTSGNNQAGDDQSGGN